MKGCTDSGASLVEVMVSMAVASIALAGIAGLLATSARAVAESELETTAIWVASRTIEQWRAQAAPALIGQQELDRDGSAAVGTGLFHATWLARPDPGGSGSWRVTATVTSGRLRQAVSAEALVRKVSP